jgi:hypothetical protein
MIRFLGVPLAVVLLAGCALVDDARREFGPDQGPTAAPSVPGPSPVAPSSPTAEPSGGCPPSGVLVRPGRADAAMGLRAMGVYLVNCGTVPYAVNGYPEVRLLDGDRQPLPVTINLGTSGVATIDNFDTLPGPVTAAPGQQLAFGMVWRNTVTDTTTGPVNGVYLEVTPAPGQPAQTVRPEGRIDVGTTGRIGITAWGPA